MHARVSLVGPPGHFESATRGANTRLCSVETPLDAGPLVVNHVVVARHPVGQDVVDARSLNQAGTAAIHWERAALPQKVGWDALRDGQWIAGLIGIDARRILAAQIHIRIAARAKQP